MSLVAEVADLARTHGMWWPEGDSGGCRELAHAWRAAAAACDYAADDAAQALKRIRVDNHGRAVDAFDDHTHDVVAALRAHADRCRNVADALLGRADQIDQARIQIELMAATIATQVIAGAAFAIFSAGLTAALAAEATALVIAEATALEIAISEATAALIGRIVAYVTINALESAVTDVALQTETALIQNQNPLTSFSFKELAFSGLSGALDGGFNGLTEFKPVMSAVGMGAEEVDEFSDLVVAHSWEKHVIKQGEFPDIKTPEELTARVQHILESPSRSKPLMGDRMAYWDDESGMLVIINRRVPEQSATFVPKNGLTYYEKELR